MKGIFITFEGIEGCGKTTQVHLLAGHLEEQGCKVLKTREPGGTEISEAVREILLSNDFVKMNPHTEVLLYLASRAQHISDKIKPALEKGMIVISDRFSDSTFVYQCYVRGIDYQIVEEMNSFTTEGISPDITFVLDLEPEEGLRRAVSRNQKHSRKEDRMEKESLEFHQKVREGYLKMAERHPDRIHVISSNRDKTEVQEEIKGIVGRILSQRGFPG
ncbi:MAG: dTMP kinase [Nitrospirae bacterium RIFCSPLOWO2_02_42_7]|nr:MAG: dTMP kinase [Nitrospirae bacterium RIFCSPLOWO2_02_42_7]